MPEDNTAKGVLAGRTIIDDQWRSMGSIILAVDHDRGILYVNDAEEPEGIMAFSLATGERIRVLPAREGDGPHEFSQGHTGMTMGPAGADEGIGPSVVNGHVLMARDPEDAKAISVRIRNARIACTDDAAYVAMNYPEGPDTVFVYHLNGDEGRLPVPTEFTEDLPECTQQIRLSSGATLPDRPCPTWNQQLYPSLDDHGNIVLMGYHPAIAGAVADPETGCYAVLRKSTPDRTLRVARIYADSALVFTRDAERTTEAGVERTVVYSGANRVSLHGIRRVSGEGCAGMVGGM